jgi:peroxiredoxin family protein
MAEKLAIMIVSEEYEKSHVASMIASVAAVSGIEVSIFVTGNAVYNFLKKNVEKKNFTGGKLYDLIKEKKAALFYELFDQAKMLGGLKIYVCSMVMDILGLEKDDLIDIVDDHLGLAAFLGIMEGAETITF